MTKVIGATESCLCGAVRVTAKQVSENVGACHCGMCRKWTGGPILAVDCGTDVSFGSVDNISVFDSSKWAERGFCNKCGSHLFYRLRQNQQCIVPVGLFDDDSRFVLHHQVFIDEKPTFYGFANGTEDMTGAEVFAKYVPSS